MHPPSDDQPETHAMADTDPDGTQWFVIAEPDNTAAWIATDHPADLGVQR